MADPAFEARRKAENQRSSGNVKGALKTLEDYLITDPHNNRVRMDLARIYIYDEKNVNFGLTQLDAILDIDPDYDDARKALVTILKRNKRYNDETDMHFKILLEKYPDDPDLLHSYGIFCREQLLDFTKAKECFARCVELKPKEEQKVGLNLNIQKTKIMASGPITSWEIDGETVETVSDFIFWGSKITAEGDCSHEIKRCLLHGRKVMTNLDSLLKSRDITLPTKVCLVKAMVFLVVMYGCESWTVKKAEH